MNQLCKECKHYRDGGVCVSSKNRKGYTSALDSSRNCWEAPDPLDGNDSVFSQQAPEPDAGKSLRMNDAEIKVEKTAEGVKVSAEYLEPAGPPTKKCKVCGKVLPLSEFPFHPKSKDGHTATCSYCHAESVRAGQASSEKVAAKRRKKELEKVAKEHEQKPIAIPEPAEIVEAPEEGVGLNENVEQQIEISIKDFPDSVIIAEMRRRQLPGCISLFSDEALGEELKRRGYVPLFEKEQPAPAAGITEEQQQQFREMYTIFAHDLADEQLNLDGGDPKKVARILGGLAMLRIVAKHLNFNIE